MTLSRLGTSLTLLIVLSLFGLAGSQPRQPTDGALYVGFSDRGRTLLATLHLFPPDGAELRLIEAPARGGGEESVELLLTAPYLTHEAELEVTTETWAFIADVLRDGALDPLGEAQLYLYELEPITLEAVGTVVLGGLSTADGTFKVQRWFPLFYWGPWGDFAPALDLEPVVREGLAQRRELADSVAGIYTESRTVEITALDRDLISSYTLFDSFTGGAHPNSWTETETLLMDDSGQWNEVTAACEAAAFLDWPCDETAVRRIIIDELEESEATWVVEGEVTAATEWLLDSFVLTPTGVTFIYDAYEVGPYVQGSFEVAVPYPNLE